MTFVNVLTGAMVATSLLAQWRDGSPATRNGSHNQCSIHGQINSDKLLTGLTVEMTSGTSAIRNITVNGDGTFEVPGLEPGAYRLQISAGAGAVVHEEMVFVSSAYQAVNISITSSTQSSGPGGMVSMRQLMHKEIPAAKREVSKARAEVAKGDQTKAVEHLKKALVIDPDYAEAHNDLGASYAAMGQMPEAAEQFQKVIDLDPDHNLALANLTIALYKMQRYHEAGQTARRALRLNPNLSNMRFILAMTLYVEATGEEEALSQLHRAASDLPKAHLLAAQILARSGKRAEAAKELEDYLQTAALKGPEREKAETWLAELRP